MGLGGNFGQVILGRFDSPYKKATSKLDVFTDTRGDYNAIVGSMNGSKEVFDKRHSNNIVYMTPDMNGFSASAGYALADNGTDDDLPMTTAQSDKDVYALNASYDAGPLFVTAAYESQNAAGTGGDDRSAMKLGGSYTIAGATTIGGVWEGADRGGANGDRDAFYLNATHKIGATTLAAGIGVAGEEGSVADTGASHYTLAAFHKLSKSTEVYALYSLVSNDASAAYTVVGVSGVTGEDVSSLSFGINHNFSSK